MKKLRKALALCLAASLALSLAACAPKESPAPGSSPSAGTDEPSERQVLAQGITDDAITIGSTMAVSGASALVGVPFIDAMNGVFNRINEKGGIGGRKIQLVHLDDGGDSANGRTLTERLVEESKVFAINGMPGTAVNTTIDYLREYGVPTVYLSTGMDLVYAENDPGSCIFPVQPNFGSDGALLAARVFHEKLYGANKDEALPADAKVGVVYGNNDTGSYLYEGFMRQVKAEGNEGRVVSEGIAAGEYAAALQKMKNEGVSVLVVLMGQIKAAIAAMNDIQFEVPTFTYYGNSSITAWSAETYNPNRPCYTSCWADYSTPEAAEALKDFYDAVSYCDADQATKDSYMENNFARAGYVAADIMVRGLQRLEDSGLDYSWENFIACMEADTFTLVTGGTLDYSNGRRVGADQEGLLEYYTETGADGSAVIRNKTLRSFETLADVLER